MDVQLKAEIKEHFDRIAEEYDRIRARRKFYYDVITELVEREIREDGRVLELGCGTGKLLERLRLDDAVAVDISAAMVKVASRKFRADGPDFVAADAEFLPLRGSFDYVVMVDLVAHLDDAYEVLRRLRRLCHQQTKIVKLR